MNPKEIPSKEKFIDLLSEALDRVSGIKMEDEFRNYDEWSSISYLSVIAMMDDEFDTLIEENEFRNIRSVQDLYNACNK